MALMAILTFFCISTLHAQSKKDRAAKQQHTMAYQCPMKCEADKTYDKAGKCPKCGMSLKEIEKPVAAVMYRCPMKCEGDKTYDKAGKCPKCNMDLKKMKMPKA